MHSFEDVRTHFAAHQSLADNEPYLISFELDTGEGRRQGIYLAELEAEDGYKLLRVSTPVAPLGKMDPAKCLRFNWAQRIGYLALNDLDRVPYLHLCENRPYDGLVAAEVDALVEEIGRLADNLERLINLGADAV